MSPAEPLLESELACPECGCRQWAVMPTDACIYFFDCSGCGAVLRPKPGHCCVFSSYGTVPCPSMQCQDGCADDHA